MRSIVIPPAFTSPSSTPPSSTPPSSTPPSSTPPPKQREKELLRTYNQRRRKAPSWSETEIEESYVSGKLTELQICNQSFRHIERYVIITKDKWLKVYEAINSKSPILVFNALDIEVKEESGADVAVLHLLLGNVQVELLLKAADKQECDMWKDAFERIHYEDVDDDLDGGLGGDVLRHRRTRSIENEPLRLGQGATSKTMPNLGKRKKAAKEAKLEAKTKHLHVQASLDSSPNANPRKRGNAISSLIRSFTIDSLGRKAKNKSYELPREPLREEDIVLKETQHGMLKLVVVAEDASETYEDRFCRIRGKIFQCYAQQNDPRPIFKIPLKNAAVEEFVNPGTSTYRFQISSFDTKEEYTFALENDQELDRWTAALCGDDQLHKSLENSPIVPRRISGSTFFTPASPVSLRASIGSKDSFTEEDETESTAQPFEKRNRSSTDPFTIIDENSVSDVIEEDRSEENALSTTTSQVSEEISNVLLQVSSESVDGKLWSAVAESTSSLSSVTTTVTSHSTLSEPDGIRSPTKGVTPTTPNKLKAVSEEPIKASSMMFEVSGTSDLSQTKSKRWVVLRKTVIETYKSEHEKQPLRILNLGTIELVEDDNDKFCHLVLKLDDTGNKLCFLAPDENTRNNFAVAIKKSARSIKRQKNPRHSVTLQIKKRLGSNDRLKELKSKKDKRMSMLLVDDDVEAIEKYEDSADLANMMAGKFVHALFNEN